MNQKIYDEVDEEIYFLKKKIAFRYGLEWNDAVKAVNDSLKKGLE